LVILSRYYIFIRLAAICLKGSIYKDDILGRIGGDEFAIIIKRNLEAAEAFAN
jgi:GGDEF domain-containing protein